MDAGRIKCKSGAERGWKKVSADVELEHVLLRHAFTV